MKNFDVVINVVEFLNKNKNCKKLRLNEDIDHVAIFLIDGLTYEQGKYLASKLGFGIEKIEAKFPTTTSAGYTSLLTLSYPTEHKLLGRLTYSKKLDEVVHVFLYSNINLEPINTLKYKIADKSIKTIFEKINCRSFCILPNKIINTKYNIRFNRGAEKIGFRNISEIPLKFEEIIKNNEKSFIWIYDSELDAMNHIYGPKSENSYNYLDILKVILEKLKNVSETYENVRILIFSDHGHSKVDENKVVDISWVIQEYINGNLLPLAIEEKYLILKGNIINKVIEELDQKNIKYIHKILDKGEIEKWFGKYNPDVDFLIDSHFILIDDYGYFALHKTEIEYPPKGAHSGITKEEKEIPLIIL